MRSARDGVAKSWIVGHLLGAHLSIVRCTNPSFPLSTGVTPMTSQENQGAVTADRKAGPQPRDPVDAMLRGRYAQKSFSVWVLKRLCDLYPK